jgi:hypothetical protein
LRKLAMVSIGLMICVFVGEGCRSRTPEELKARQAIADERAAAKVVPESSRFKKLYRGMKMTEVSAAIGEPASKSGHLMGKNFNPFYFGMDRYRTTWFYRNEGRIIFNTKAVVMKIEYDPKETGVHDEPKKSETPKGNA